MKIFFHHIYNLINKKILKYNILNPKILIMGYTFKENCSDIRNTGVNKLYLKFKKNYNTVHVYDELISKEIRTRVKIIEKRELKKNKYDVIIIAVKHSYFRNIDI